MSDRLKLVTINPKHFHLIEMSSKFIIDLKDFQIIESLGSGSYGQVYLVEQKSTKNTFIAKVSKELCTESNQKAFSNSIKSFYIVQSPAILKFIGYSLTNFVDEKYPTIITEFVKNKSLNLILEKESLGKPPINWNTSKKYINILGIAIGMQQLHSKGVINRNLKPSNILIDENMYPHIGDFSIYKLIKSTATEFKEKDTCTSLYTAPEVYFKDKYTNKVDVYSFSYIAYELILGRPINLGDKPIKDFMKEVNDGKRPDLSMIAAPAVKEFLEKCWSKDPQKRPSFDQIIEIIGNRDFFIPFNINKNEVISYIDLFEGEFKGKKFILDQINEDINEDLKRAEKVQRNKNPIKMFIILILVLVIQSFLKQIFSQ